MRMTTGEAYVKLKEEHKIIVEVNRQIFIIM